MLSWLMKKIGFISISEAEKYDSVLIYKIDGKVFSRKIVDYFNDDGIAFRDRNESSFTLDDINAEEIKIIDFNGNVVLDVDDRINEKQYVDRIELMIFLYADIVENKAKVSDILLKDLITKFKMATSYNSKRTIEDIETAIAFMKSKIWVDLYGKTYDEFAEDI